MGKRLVPLLLLLAIPVCGQRTVLPIMERLFGATSANAVTGNTRLTVAVSKYGELVGLRWPCPSYYDHLNYKTLHLVPFGWTVEDYNRFYNAGRRKGAYFGIKYTLNGETFISWPRTDSWTQKQYYESAFTPIVVTEFKHAELGLTLTCTDFVDHQKDVLYRRFAFMKSETAPLIYDLQLIHCTNLAPCNQKPLFNPVKEWQDDDENGYVTFFDRGRDCFLSFNPENQDAFEQMMKSPQPERLVHAIDSVASSRRAVQDDRAFTIYTRDIYIAVGADRHSAGWSLFEDGSRPKPLSSMESPNNTLIAHGPALCAHYFDIAVDQMRTDTLTIVMSVDDALGTALAVLDSARHAYATAFTRTREHWRKKTGAATIPAVKDTAMESTLQRTLINCLLSVNADAGGISGSPTSMQPPYTSIWPRDGAVIGLILDCAGYTEEAEENARFFARVQRKEDGQDCRRPRRDECFAGTWFHCYYADGRPSWVYDMEIDQVGWTLWMWYMHGLFLDADGRRIFYASLQKNIELAADFLVAFKDPKNNLQRKAIEDDLPWKSQSVYGAATVIFGLKSAIGALEFVGAENSKITAYHDRLKDLETAVGNQFWNPKRRQYGDPVYASYGPLGFVIWPAVLHPPENSKMHLHANSIHRQLIPFFSKSDNARNKEWWYLGKATTALAYIWADDPRNRKTVEQYLSILLKEVCTPDTRIYGETPMVRDFFRREGDGSKIERRYHNRVGQPHNSAAAWIYLTAEMLYGSHKELLKSVFSPERPNPVPD